MRVSPPPLPSTRTMAPPIPDESRAAPARSLHATAVGETSFPADLRARLLRRRTVLRLCANPVSKRRTARGREQPLELGAQGDLLGGLRGSVGEARHLAGITVDVVELLVGCPARIGHVRPAL